MTSESQHQPAGTRLDGVDRTILRDRGSASRGSHSVNPVILALVVALRDVEERRGRGKVLTHLTSKRPAA